MSFLDALGLLAVRFEGPLFGAGFNALPFLTGVPFLTEVRLDFAPCFLFFVVVIHAVYHGTTVWPL